MAAFASAHEGVHVSHSAFGGQLRAVVPRLARRAVVPGPSLLQVGHGGGALDVDEGVKLGAAGGCGGGQGRGGGARRVGIAPVGGTPVGAAGVHLHLDVVEGFGRLGDAPQWRPAEVKVEDGGAVGAATSRVRAVRTERRRHVLRVHVVVGGLQGGRQGVGVGVVEAVVAVAVERGRLQAAAPSPALLVL